MWPVACEGHRIARFENVILRLVQRDIQPAFKNKQKFLTLVAITFAAMTAWLKNKQQRFKHSVGTKQLLNLDTVQIDVQRPSLACLHDKPERSPTSEVPRMTVC